MVNDPRFRRRKERVIAQARFGRAAAALVTTLLPPDPSKPGRIGARIERLLREAARAIGNGAVDCTLADLEALGHATSVQATDTDTTAAYSHQLIATFSRRVMQLLKEQPDALRRLPGRVFEDVLAEILAFLRFEDISLRVTTEAGEIDLLGFSRDVMGSRIGYVFELKQLGVSGRAVELREVTRLFGIREGLRYRLGLAQGVFVTTTAYTHPATTFATIYNLSLKGYEDLVTWLRAYDFKAGGLHFLGS